VKRALLILAAGLALAACKTNGEPAINAETQKACKFLNGWKPHYGPPRPLAAIQVDLDKVEACDLALSMDRLANRRAAELIFERLDLVRGVLEHEGSVYGAVLP